MIQRNSLSFRLAASAATVSLVLLVAAGILLGYLFREAVERNFDARLQAVLDGLLANVELDDKSKLTIPRSFADTRFKLPFSGWYWQITALPDKNQELVSGSLLEQRLDLGDITAAPRDKAGVARVYLSDSEGTRLRAIEQRYTLFGSKDQFSFVVAGNFDELRSEISAFENALFVVLALLGAGLLIAVLAQVRYAMGPLRMLQSELTSIRQGSAETLNEQYPSEIQPVAHELNLLVKSNTEVVERARTQVGNLAHALKTPLSVLANDAETNSRGLAAKVKEQTQVMRDQINMYLDRARRAARARSLGTACDPKEVVDAIVRTLLKIHADRNIEADVICPDKLKFRGERQDLEEMVGNLLDNAFKWTTSKVTVNITRGPDTTGDGRLWLEIAVEDNGPGLPADQREQALERGQRLDETKPGSGLGLSIVSETAAMYNGSVKLGKGKISGLLITLRLPALKG
ncbi:MAG: HAMP domain-containing histidine kinase [Hyphomicrobiales bacterium]|nr:HAMP domain-containing histidine kinase [Hyphomicrobiales bacterium]